MRVYFCLLITILVSLSFFSCKKEAEPTTQITEIKKSRFNGKYKSFDDLHELHMEAALKNGIIPMKSKNDTTDSKDKIVQIPNELNFYKTDKLTHSIPYLVKDASKLLMQIGINFQDSLRCKKLPQYKLVITSLTRTDEDVSALTKRNVNASENSVHRYATTFDISWKRFIKIGKEGKNDIQPQKLKLILAEVLHDLRENNKCYIKHENKQACFHITVR